LIADPRVLAVPILGKHEEFVDLKDQSEIACGPSPEIPNNQDYTKIRKTVYQKLKEAQAILPKGLRFCLYEGYRSLSLQKMLFDNRVSVVKELHPAWSWDKVFDEAMKMVSPIMNKDTSKNIPPHSTGAAVDLYLINDAGEAMEMGIHPRDWKSDIDGSLSLTNSSSISAEARYYRGIMGIALEAVGFVNYPTEYWHWSYGDRYWAYQKGQPAAIYGSVMN